MGMQGITGAAWLQGFAHVQLSLGFIETLAVVRIDNENDGIHLGEVFLPDLTSCDKVGRKCISVYLS